MLKGVSTNPLNQQSLRGRISTICSTYFLVASYREEVRGAILNAAFALFRDKVLISTQN